MQCAPVAFSGLWFDCVDGEVSSFHHYHMNSGLPFISELVLSTNTFLTSSLSPTSRAEGVTCLLFLVLLFSATLAALLVAIL